MYFDAANITGGDKRKSILNQMPSAAPVKTGAGRAWHRVNHLM
jgi:hypothetical protein